MSDTSELSNLLPDQVTVEVAGERITLRAFTVEHLPMYLRTKRSIHAKALALGKELAAQLPAGQEVTPDDVPLDVVLERCYDEFVEQVAAATRKPREWVNGLGIDELAGLMGVINTLNDQKYHSKKGPALRVVAQGQ